VSQHLEEKHWRTAARAISYRALAMISSFIMVGIASGIVVEIVKTGIYYTLERLWLRVNWQINNGRESQLRIVTRAVVYRMVATVAVAYWVGIEMALWLAVVQTLLFYVNEMVWLHISREKTVAPG